jgi:hypothetical protein
MKKRTKYVLLSAIGIIALGIAIFLFIGWVNRPLPVSLDDPSSQPIKDVLAKSHEIEGILFCDPKSDVNMLDEVYIDTSDYKPSNKNKILIAKYLGDSSSKQAGYLTFRKAYHLWDRSGDEYPQKYPSVTSDNSTKIAPTEKPMRYCPDISSQPNLIFREIAIRENKAVVTYDAPGSLNEATLIKVDGQWYIANIRVLQITV